MLVTRHPHGEHPAEIKVNDLTIPNTYAAIRFLQNTSHFGHAAIVEEPQSLAHDLREALIEATWRNKTEPT